MNAFSPVADGTYIYGKAAAGSQIKFKKSDFISLISGSIILESKGNRAHILQPNVGIVFAYDSTNVDKNLMYVYFRNNFFLLF